MFAASSSRLDDSGGRGPLGTVGARFRANALAHTEASWRSSVENQRLTHRPR